MFGMGEAKPKNRKVMKDELKIKPIPVFQWVDDKRYEDADNLIPWWEEEKNDYIERCKKKGIIKTP